MSREDAGMKRIVMDLPNTTLVRAYDWGKDVEFLEETDVRIGVLAFWIGQVKVYQQDLPGVRERNELCESILCHPTVSVTRVSRWHSRAHLALTESTGAQRSEISIPSEDLLNAVLVNLREALHCDSVFLLPQRGWEWAFSQSAMLEEPVYQGGGSVDAGLLLSSDFYQHVIAQARPLLLSPQTLEDRITKADFDAVSIRKIFGSDLCQVAVYPVITRDGRRLNHESTSEIVACLVCSRKHKMGREYFTPNDLAWVREAVGIIAEETRNRQLEFTVSIVSELLSGRRRTTSRSLALESSVSEAGFASRPPYDLRQAKEVVKDIVEELFPKCGADTLSLRLVSHDSQSLVRFVGYPQLVMDQDLSAISVSHENSVVARAFRLGERQYVHGEKEILQIPGRTSRSELAYPLFVNERPVGVLNIEASRERAFDRTDLFANLASVAVSIALGEVQRAELQTAIQTATAVVRAFHAINHLSEFQSLSSRFVAEAEEWMQQLGTATEMSNTVSKMKHASQELRNDLTASIAEKDSESIRLNTAQADITIADALSRTRCFDIHSQDVEWHFHDFLSTPPNTPDAIGMFSPTLLPPVVAHLADSLKPERERIAELFQRISFAASDAAHVIAALGTLDSNASRYSTRRGTVFLVWFRQLSRSCEFCLRVTAPLASVAKALSQSELAKLFRVPLRTPNPSLSALSPPHTSTGCFIVGTLVRELGGDIAALPVNASRHFCYQLMLPVSVPD